MRVFLVLFLLIFSINCEAKENQTIQITLEVKECQLSVITNKETYQPGEQIKFYNNITPITKDFSISYFITTQNNSVLKKTVTTKNLNEKHFTPKIRNHDELLIIKSEISSRYCNADAEKTVLVKGEPNLTSQIKPKNKNKTIVKQEIKSATNKTKTSLVLNQEKTYEIEPLGTTETLLNQELPKNQTESISFISGEEKSKEFAKYGFIIAIILLIVGIKYYGTKNKNNH